MLDHTAYYGFCRIVTQADNGVDTRLHDYYSRASQVSLIDRVFTDNLGVPRRLSIAPIPDHRRAFAMTIADQMREKLTAAFSPSRLDIVDESARHAGHSGWRPGGETHFDVEIVSEAFAGKSRLERQRAVHAVLNQELATTVHALSLRLLTPAEAG